MPGTAQAEATEHRRLRRTGWLVAAGACLLALALAHVRAWRFTADDAFISFRYAENWVRFGLPVYNPLDVDPRPVEGYTNFGWVVLLAAAHGLGADIPSAAAVLGAVSLAGAWGVVVALAWWLAASWRPAFGALAAGALAAATPEFVVWGTGGLEGPLAAALAWGAAYAFERGRPRRAGLLGALAVLVRPDAVVVPATFVIARVAADPARRRPAALLRLSADLAWGLPLLVAHLVFRWVVYGALLPQTFAMKAGGVALAGTYGRAYLAAWAWGVGPWTLVVAAFGLGRRALPVAAAVVAHLVYVVLVGGDFMAYGRLALPATCGVLVLFGCGIGRLASLSAARRRGAARWAAFGVAAVVVGLASRAAFLRHRDDMARTSGWIDGRFEGVHTMDRFARVRRVAGERLAERVPPRTRIVVGAAGALPYASRLPAWDAFGLVVPGAPKTARVLPPERSRPGHQRVVPEAVLSRFDPDLACHVGYHGPRPPGPARIPRSMRRDHVFACVELGRIDDPHAPSGSFDGGYYCCLRRRDRLADVFAASP
ncbi:MAG: hypothetical protein D6705_11705 [Deltaproteobacteria bacterium]|nr:MAG: hypothetical protein D6705_11705 [Deltaproteobacteria bacterium]